MLQRVMIAGALLGEPELLLADEPTTALDVTTQAEVVAILGDLQAERSLAMLFITHDLELATAICDRTAVMYAGEVVEQQPSEILHAAPLHPYTSGLLGSRPSLEDGTRSTADDRGSSDCRGRRCRGMRVRAALRLCAGAVSACEDPKLVAIGVGRGRLHAGRGAAGVGDGRHA